MWSYDSEGVGVWSHDSEGIGECGHVIVKV